MELLRHLWSVPGTRILLIVISAETLFISATIAWLIIQNRLDDRDRARETKFTDTLAESFYEAVQAPTREALDRWHERAENYADDIVRDFLHRAIQRTGGEERQRLVDAYRRWGYVEHDHRLMSSRSPRKRLFALRRLHAVATRDDRDLLMERVGDEYLERILTAQVIARIDHPDDIFTLLGDITLRSGMMEEPLYATIEQIDREKFRYIFEHRDRFQEPRIRRILLEVATERGLEEAADAAVDASRSDSLEEKIGACNAAAFLGRETGRGILMECIDDEQWQVRARAAKVLRRFPDDDVFDALTTAITDEAFWVRQNAANSLRWMGSDGIERLEAIRAQDEDAYAADSAAQELQRYERLSTPDQRQLSIGPRGVA